MPGETIRLDVAARSAGVHVETLQRWLEKDLGLVFPRMRRGQVRLIAVGDFEQVRQRRMARRRWAKG